MFDRILQLQTNEYGPQDRRCFVTMEKINMVRRRGGTNFETAVDDLRRTFSSPLTSGPEEPTDESPSNPHDSKDEPIEEITEETKARPLLPKSYSVPSVPSTKGKNQKTLLKVFNSMRKKKPAVPR
jgi:hypothetical protein